MKIIKIAEAFIGDAEYELFSYNYCENGCKFHKERYDGLVETVENGGCPIENRCVVSMVDRSFFPNVLLEAYDENECCSFCHCPFYTPEYE